MLFGIDLGGTKTEVAVLDEHSAAEICRRRVSTVKGSYADTIKTIAGLIAWAEAETSCSCRSFGVAIPGAVSHVTHRIKNANSSWLIGHQLQEDLQSATGCAVYLANDANCFALSESHDGAGAGAGTVWGLILGTGSGSGIVVNGTVLSGRNELAGEWGHNPLPWQTAADQAAAQAMSCYCGRTGCIETFVSGTGFELEYLRQTGQRKSGPEIYALMQQGEAAAVKTFELYADRLARALACFANFLDPDVIVLGGGMSNLKELYPLLPQLVSAYIFGGEFSTPIVPAQHGDSSGVRGAAFLTLHHDI